ncbi:MAG: helix-turn-helix domain-containing protein [Fibrobacteraceae bacterium]|nr:helix-turn-helix domain-containing protein [Fibrobacteraceae bacterium]
MSAENLIDDKQSGEKLGTYLARAREAHGYSVADLSHVSGVTKDYIESIEKGEWKKFPIEAYLRGYLNSICGRLGLDSKKVFEWYRSESGSNYQSDFAFSENSTKISPMAEETTSKHSKAVPIVLIVLGLAFLVAYHFMESFSGEEQVVTQETTPSEIVSTEDPVAEAIGEMPEGAEAVPVDSMQKDSAVATEDVKKDGGKVSQAEVDEAIKKSDLPASATIFISSTSKSDSSKAPEKPRTTGSKTRFELIGSGEARTWVGLKRREDDGSFLREANIASAGTRMVYNTNDTLLVVIGEPSAIAKLMLNGVETPLPQMKFGRVTRFRVFGGRIIK